MSSQEVATESEVSMTPPAAPANPSSPKKNGSMVTPTHTPIRNKALESLKNSQTPKSPFLQIPATPVMQRLGYGTGVGVYLLERSPRPNGALRSPWAIKKTVKVADSDDAYATRLEYEAEILKKLSHPNIIGYRAFGKISPDNTFLAMEKASKSLGDLIEERVGEIFGVESPDSDDLNPFPAKTIEKVGLNIAKALAYLHDEARMVHGDVKSANVLVFGDFESIKLCDFGVARKLGADGNVEGYYVGTEIWNSREVLESKKNPELKVNQKADIYPYGLVLYEMITLKPPHLSTAEESYLMADVSTVATDGDVSTSDIDTTLEDTFDEGAFDEILTRHIGTRPPLPDLEFDSGYDNVLGIFFCCTEEDPSKRPNAKDISVALTELSETEKSEENLKNSDAILRLAS